MWSLQELSPSESVSGDVDVESPNAFHRGIQLGWDSVSVPRRIEDSFFSVNTYYAPYTFIVLSLLFDRSLSHDLSKKTLCPVVPPRVARYYSFDIRKSDIRPTDRQGFDIDHGQEDRLLGPIADKYLIHDRVYDSVEPQRLSHFYPDLYPAYEIEEVETSRYSHLVEEYGVLMGFGRIIVTDSFFETLTSRGRNPFVKAIKL